MTEADVHAPTEVQPNRPIQRSHATRLDRHPALFACVKDVAVACRLDRPTILSFGCSTGEEAHTLATKYFPDAAVIGVDVVSDVVATAMSRYGGNPNIRFAHADELSLAPQTFDIVFAMSVLCRWPITRRMDDIAELYPFAAFEEHVAHLDTLLKPGGVMVIYNANYSFLLAGASLDYDLIVDPRVARPPMVKRFRRNGRSYPGASGTDCIYLKRAAGELANKACLTLRDHKLQEIGMIERGLARG